MRFKFVFYSKGIRQLKQLKLSLLFDLTPLSNADIFFTAR